ncbi:hypothetical protein JTE90_013032 [Oedothorax gibbosus]|uniref:Uncharacterized protein n=1 Tax=Oedothorax gibbosus TaxID=931172 RepID=A0AAV6UI59_9ARAC|nr:hypothetical protein JTE90_013032 [Oedothorax gibbosus]
MSSGRNVFLKFEERRSNDRDSSSESGNKLIVQTLNQIFPPLATTENGQQGHLRISTKQAAIHEIKDLEKELDAKLKKECKKEVPGFGRQINQVYQQVFQELIRQETIECPERGLLYKLVFDEFNISVRSLEKCVKSTFSNAVSKALLSRSSVLGMGVEIPKLERRLQEARTLAEGMQRERREGLPTMEEIERVKMIEFEFLENQVEKANQEMIKTYEDIVDEEHRWLKDTI